MKAPEKIYLQPECCVDPEFGQTWCDTDSPVDCEDGARWTGYIREDLAMCWVPIESAELKNNENVVALLQSGIWHDAKYYYGVLYQVGDDDPLGNVTHILRLKPPNTNTPS